MYKCINLFLFEKDTVLNSLEIFWKGLLAILIAIAVVYLLTIVLTKICTYIDKQKCERVARKQNADNLSKNKENEQR